MHAGARVYGQTDNRPGKAWFADMGEHAAEMIAEGADADLLARFEACANQWLVNQGVPNPPFSVVRELGRKGVV